MSKTTSTHLTERLRHEARTLLGHTNLPITDIAESLGFADDTASYHFFRRQTGLSPTAFRQQDS